MTAFPRQYAAQRARSAAAPTATTHWLLALWLAVCALMAACGGGNADIPGPSLPTLSAQPTDQSVVVGQTATFSANATGADALSYQWSSSADGIAFTPIAGATAATYTTAQTSLAQNGTYYRVVVTNSLGSTTSSAAKLTVSPSIVPVAITAQPADQHVIAPTPDTFSVTAAGTTPSYQWQSSPDGSTWSDVAGATATGLTIDPTTVAQTGTRYRVLVSNSAGSVTSSAARLFVDPAPSVPVFTAQPTDQSVTAPNAASFTASASGTPTPGYQWQSSSDGGTTYTNIGGATGSTYSIASTTTALSGTLFRVIASNTAGSATSNAARLTVSPTPQAPSFTLQPQPQTVTTPTAANFTAAAGGVPTPSYQWQSSSNGGASYANINGATGSSYTTGATSTSDSGTLFRVIASNSAGSATSNAAALTVLPPPNNVFVTTSPASLTVPNGATATFTAAATGSPSPTVQWQQSTDAGATFTDLAGATSTTLSFTAALAQSGNQYRAVFTNGTGSATTTAAILTVQPPANNVIVTVNPADVSVTDGTTATFTAAATGSPAPTVQWQQSTDAGVTFTNLAGATSTTLSFTAALAQSGNRYRAVFTNSTGSGTTSAAALVVSPASFPVTVVPLSVGDTFACAIKADTTVACWGWNAYGQIGVGVTPGNQQLTPATVVGLTQVVQIAAGDWHACALKSDNTVVCWGYGAGGEMGNGTITPQNFVPGAPVTGLSGVVQIAAGGHHTCALKTDTSVVCWGQGLYGQLGNGSTSGSTLPVTVTGLTGVAWLAGGDSHTCAIKTDATVVCWGLNTYGALGDGTTTNRLTPVAVSGLSSVVSVSGSYYHSCAARSDGAALCWGLNGAGQVGVGTAQFQYLTPVLVAAAANFKAMDVGGNSACALLTDGTAKCWGINSSGALGDGTTVDRNVPVAVLNVASATSVSFGNYAGCALISDGSVKCWGDNGYGQLGDGTTANRSIAAPVSGGAIFYK